MSLRQLLFSGFLLCSIVLFPSVVFSLDDAFKECMRKQEERRTDPRGDFTQYSFKSVDEVLKDPEVFWKFITAPETPYIERRTAATRAMTVLSFNEVPAKWLPRILQAQDELEEPARIYFGLLPPPCWQLPMIMNGRKNPAEERIILGHSWKLPEEKTPYIERRTAATRAMTVLPFSKVPVKWIPRLLKAQDELEVPARIYFGLVPPRCWALPMILKGTPGKEQTILGHSWTPPKEGTPYPLTFDEELQAPWPWQVQEALKDASSSIYRELEKPGRTEELLKGVMALPVSTDDEARLFVKITNYFSMHHKTVDVMARWYKFAMDPQKPKTAAMVATEIGQAARLWDDPQSRSIGDVILIDLIRTTTDDDILWKAVYSYLGLHNVEIYDKNHGKKVVNSPTAIKLITEKVLDPASGDEWSRVYYFALVLAELLDDPPITYAGIKDHVHEDGQLKTDLQAVQSWYSTHKAELEKASAQEEPALNRIRALLKNVPRP